MSPELLIHISRVQDTLVILFYWAIAIQFYKRSDIGSKAGRSFFLLIAIFILTAINGYLANILQDIRVVSILRVISMVPLIGILMWYTYRGMILDVHDAIQRDSEAIDEKIRKYKERMRKNGGL